MIKSYIKKFSLLAFILICSGLTFYFPSPIEANDVSVQLLPAPPVNAAAVQTTATEITLTWDASPSNAAFIDSYTIFYKLDTDPSYPLVPQITRNDTEISYSEAITVLPNKTYNFIVFANTTNGFSSSENCPSCKASNATCGNAIIEGSEACEGVDFQGAMCTDFGYIGGNLSCSGACTLNYASCTSPVPPTSSGSGGSSKDKIPPTAGKVISPPYSNGSPIKITYSGGGDEGGSGLDKVTLFYKKGSGLWIKSSLSSTEASGNFNFIPPNEANDTYYFALQAEDNSGNSSPYPNGLGDTSTLYDTTKPTIESVTIPKNATGSIAITYQNASDPYISGLKEVQLWYKKEKSGSWTNTFLTNSQAAGSFNFSGFKDSGEYYFDLIALDQAGNLSLESLEALTPTVYDAQAPIFDSLSAGKIVLGENSLSLTYNGAKDVGVAGLKSVELWVKKEGGNWINSGLIKSASVDSFVLNPLPSAGTYYFALVLEDNFGNKSPQPSGNGDLSVVLGKKPFQVLLTNLPPLITDSDSENIGVWGENVASYKYKINEGMYSKEIPIGTPIILENLPQTDYTLSVLVKNSDGIWQEPSKPTTYTWTVDFSEPQLIITGPFVSDEKPDEVIYQLNYIGVEESNLALADIALNKTGTASGQFNLNQNSPTSWAVKVTNISGLGELWIAVKSDTAISINGKPVQAGKSLPFVVEVKEDDEEKLTSLVKLLKKTTPSIVPPPPAINYSDFQLQQKVIEAINEIPRISGIAFADVFPSISSGRLESCQKDYKGLDFETLQLDSDSDGLSNRTECYLKTNPLRADTDQDSCLDGNEVNLLGLNPLNSYDCPFKDGNKVVWITSPQNNWLVSRLEIMGLTPDDTSTVTLFAFPVENEKANTTQTLMLGKIKAFNPSQIKGHNFFELTPKVSLRQGQSYDLLAVSVLSGGKTLSSPPVRFTFDEKAVAASPTPLTIGDASIPKGLKLANVHVSQTENGKVLVTGNSEYGAQVFAVWQSVVLASSIITDSELGGFKIESPQALEAGQRHKVTLYALKYDDTGARRSPNVEVHFFLHPFNWRLCLLILLLIKATVLIIIVILRKYDKSFDNFKVLSYNKE